MIMVPWPASQPTLMHEITGMTSAPPILIRPKVRGVQVTSYEATALCMLLLFHAFQGSSSRAAASTNTV